MAREPRLTLTGVVKSYGAVRAIRHADFEIQPGQVHALVGENGAGKSTLIKIISGATAPDAGAVTYDGAPVTIGSTVDAISLGIATVYQEPQLFSELTVAENIFMGREIVTRGRVDWAAQNDQVVTLLESLDLPAKFATATVGSLSVATQQQVSIAKALAGDAGVLILDEPSAILTDAEIEVLFGIIRRLAGDGVAVIYISHRLDEVVKIADQVTVMRDGSTIGTYPIADMTVRKMAELMVGEALSEQTGPRTTPKGEPVLELKSLARAGSFHDVSLELRSGEILGLYGLVGSGVAEIAECIHGLAKTSGGEIVVEGRAVAPRSPREAARAGIALLPANRKTEGMFSFQSIAFNVSIGHLSRLSFGRAFVDRRRERTTVTDLMKRLAVRASDENQAVGTLSGGNAQKVMLARQLVERPKLLLLAEPTQGVDIGAKEEIHRIITDLADNGTAVLVVTSDLQEALRITDRLLVVRAGTIAAEFGNDARQVDVLAAAAGDREGVGHAVSTTLDPNAAPTAAPVKTRGRVLPSPVTSAEIALIAVLVVLWIVLAFATPAFLSAGSIIPLLVEVAPVALIGIGMTFVIITGGIDVSVGAAIMVCSVVTARLMRDAALPVWWCLVVALGTGAVLGLLNGVLIAYGRVHAIIITFGTANLFLFIGLQVFGSTPVSGMPNTLAWFGRGLDGRTLGVPNSFAITVILAAIAWWYLRHTPGGRHFFAVGGDPVAARLAGIRVQRRILIAYVITGLLVGLASIFTLAKGTSNLDQSVGSGQELAVIAAVVIGGTSIMGGRGSVLGTLLGALLVQTVKSGVTQMGWPSQLSDLFVGIFIIVAVGTDLLRRRARRDP